LVVIVRIFGIFQLHQQEQTLLLILIFIIILPLADMAPLLSILCNQTLNNLTGPLPILFSVASIGAFASSSCSGLTGPLIIPTDVTSLGSQMSLWVRLINEILCQWPRSKGVGEIFRGRGEYIMEVIRSEGWKKEGYLCFFSATATVYS
jgi:hypothetical protein